MKHPVELVTALDEANRQACRAYDINDKSLNDESPQNLVGPGCFNTRSI